MIRAVALSENGIVQTDIQRGDYLAMMKDPNGLLWVDMVGEPDDEIETTLREVFDFHPLAVDDALVETHIPKVDDWGHYLYLVMRGVVVEENEELEIQIPELDIFLGIIYTRTSQDRL